MNALNFDILDETVALHSYMHDIGDKVIHYFAKKKKIYIIASPNLSASFKIHSIPEWHPFTSQTE